MMHYFAVLDRDAFEREAKRNSNQRRRKRAIREIRRWDREELEKLQRAIAEKTARTAPLSLAHFMVPVETAEGPGTSLNEWNPSPFETSSWVGPRIQGIIGSMRRHGDVVVRREHLKMTLEGVTSVSERALDEALGAMRQRGLSNDQIEGWKAGLHKNSRWSLPPEGDDGDRLSPTSSADAAVVLASWLNRFKEALRQGLLSNLDVRIRTMGARCNFTILDYASAEELLRNGTSKQVDALRGTMDSRWLPTFERLESRDEVTVEMQLLEELDPDDRVALWEEVDGLAIYLLLTGPWKRGNPHPEVGGQTLLFGAALDQLAQTLSDLKEGRVNGDVLGEMESLFRVPEPKAQLEWMAKSREPEIEALFCALDRIVGRAKAAGKQLWIHGEA